MDSNGIVVYLYNKGGKNFDVPITDKLTAEDVCKIVTKHLQLRPIALHLFSLRIEKSSGIWLAPCFKFDKSQFYQVEFRLRFKVPSLTHLSRVDENSFDYLFHQIRHDLLHGDIPDVTKDQTKSEALGLCVTDMFRTIIEDGITREYVEKNYSQFIPKCIYKQPMFFLKKRIHEQLTKLLNIDRHHNVASAKYIKEQYISQVEELAPRYLVEEYHAMTYKEDEYPATIRVDPFHPEQPGVSISYIGKQNWEHICSIEDLCFISMRGDCTAEISRKNGIPICFKFKSIDQVQSYVSVLDGYYRLCEKWTFNLCKDLPTPSLSQLKFFKCHGPVGEKFAYEKLSKHPTTATGSFILRQSSSNFSSFCLDYILQNKSRPFTKEINCTAEGKYVLEKHSQEFSSVLELISHFIANPQTDFILKECLPPSEYDRTPLLLCRKQNARPDRSLAKNSETQDASIAPQCISARSLQIYRGKRFEYEGKTCKIFKAVWKQSKTTSVDVAIKFLKKENEEQMMKELLEMADRCVLWQCDSLVALRGIVLGNPQALILDWMPLGPLDVYLKENSLHVEGVELIEAASHIGKAIWFLEDHGIVHGNIRCHNVMVYEHSESAFIVKLSDPSIIKYTADDIHWIPPEFFEIPSLAKSFVSADIWAVGTTLWEVFSYGEKPLSDLPQATYKSKYSSGWRLPRPTKCPLEIHRVILECWSKIPDSRKQPQAIVRDIHQILYQLIGSKRVHSYSTITPASSEGSRSQINEGFDVSSDLNWTTFGSDPNTGANSISDGTMSTFIHDMSLHSGSNNSNSTQCTWLFQGMNGSPSPDLISGFSGVYTHGSIGTIYSTGSAAQGIYVFEKDKITLGRMIGEGCYGAVYVGELVRSDGSSENVAVKMMKDKDSIPEKEQLDFQREFEILQSLCHPNVVEVKGVVYDPGLLIIMEYLPMGSLLDYFRISYTKPVLRQLLKFVQDVAEGMEYLSANNIVHRDLAARNILVANDDLVKISDFGLARFTDNDNCYTFRTSRNLPIKWYPPESLQYGKFSEHSDVWSYGVTVYEIFSYGQEPNLPGLTGNLEKEDDIIELLTKGVRLACPETCPDLIYNQLMLPCWQLKPQDRPSFSKILGDIREVEYHLG